MAGIYLHIPFCKQACHYCNFHFSTSLKLKGRLVDALVKEIAITCDYLNENRLSSIYFGGGTPSLLEPQELEMIFEALAKYYSWDHKTEITIEANPDDVTPEKLLYWKKIGINRLSVGIQSFFDEDLKWMNRAHSSKEADRSIILAQDKGFENLTIDLIYGSPTTTNDMWIKNIDKALSYDIDHISSYCLTVEKGTALAHFVSNGKSKDVDQERASNQFDILIDNLTGKGYDHYEISNFARNGQYSVHNSSYWKGEAYLGIGPGAHSYYRNSRRWNIANNMKYIKGIENNSGTYSEEMLSPVDMYNEYIITRLRTKWGVSESKIPVFLKKHFTEKVKKMKNEGYIKKYSDSFVLTRKGKHFADFISVELMVDGS